MFVNSSFFKVKKYKTCGKDNLLQFIGAMNVFLVDLNLICWSDYRNWYPLSNINAIFIIYVYFQLKLIIYMLQRYIVNTILTWQLNPKLIIPYRWLWKLFRWSIRYRYFSISSFTFGNKNPGPTKKLQIWQVNKYE